MRPDVAHKAFLSKKRVKINQQQTNGLRRALQYFLYVHMQFTHTPISKRDETCRIFKGFLQTFVFREEEAEEESIGLCQGDRDKIFAKD